MFIKVIDSPSGDWEGVYINGRLKFEGHSITWWQMLDALGIEYESAQCDEEWIHDRGRLPDRLSGVKYEEDEG